MSTMGGGAVGSLDILAKIISDPDLYEKRLTELKEMQDAIVLAGTNVAKAQAALDANKAALKKAQAKFSKETGDFLDEKTDVQRKAEAFDAREAAVSAREAMVKTNEATLKTNSTAQEKWIADKLDELNKREAAVAKREAEVEALQSEPTETRSLSHCQTRETPRTSAMSKLDCGGNWIACPSYIGNTAGSSAQYLPAITSRRTVCSPTVLRMALRFTCLKPVPAIRCHLALPSI